MQSWDNVYNSDLHKYQKTNKVLAQVYAKYTRVDEDEMEKHKNLVTQILNHIIKKMCAADDCFDELYSGVIINGSVGDDLKVDKADEFDWDFVLKLPHCVKHTLTFSNVPGYVNVACVLPKNLPKSYRKLENFVDEKGFLLTAKIREYIETLLHKVLRNCSFSRAYEIKGCTVTITKIRPGFTMVIKSHSLSYPVSVDIVTTFEFNSECWPRGKFRRPNIEHTFYIVPKETTTKIESPERYWRLSAQKQEYHVLHHKYNLRPSLMLLKKTRDYMGLDEIASYHIKTVCMNELEKANQKFWTISITYCYMHLLYALTLCFEKKQLPCYWNENDNLIEHLDDRKCSLIASHLKRIYKSIIRSKDPEKIVEFLPGQSMGLSRLLRDRVGLSGGIKDDYFEVLSNSGTASVKIMKTLDKTDVSDEDYDAFEIDLN